MSRLKALLKMLEVDAADADVLYMIAQEHAREGSWADAVAWYDKCIAAEEEYAYAYFHKARAQESAGDARAAAHTLRAGLAAAKRVGDAKAMSEIGAYLDELEG